ncbi:tRNA (adenine(58)-N(1))-methyltransferase non-catalytic subunit TRM6 [Heracleum sosnowskyi]|uniref:tRNA (adenine(58)-N(1))-methyltransferase non-catalytic subunit TRM6 n=1 Tax=Heracleum sosnowskyi TaxID=360622 RepID=A0AAD8IU24_9APIA|nr:tRNA (adenine(58)-N(1))-methyltransferase non-catalytic subunit TRM6 [Heracleum sosnowskyi]
MAARVSHDPFGKTLKIGNKTYSLQPLIGCHFGSLFQVETGGNGPFLSPVIQESNQEEKGCKIDDPKDNRALVDNNTAQTLTGDEIDVMRREGATGNEIVEALIANSATFDKKTSFSQEKYRLKKQKKYAPRVLLRRPFARSICETYFKKYPTRIGFLRVDSLSLLLSMANITAHSDVLVVDMIGGLLTGAVAERMGGMGYVCNTYIGVNPYPIDIVRMFNFSDEICKRIVQSPLTELSACENEISLQHGPPEDSCNTVSLSNEKLASPTSDSVIVERIWIFKPHNGRPGYGCLDYCQRSPPTSVVFSSFCNLPPISSAACNMHAQFAAWENGNWIANAEPWLREYQVLPSRTHPHMQMSAFGGYILTGTRICSA